MREPVHWGAPMSAEDLAKGIEALEDDGVRAQVVEGDLSAFTGLELTEEEQALLEAAASEYPEVVGFSIQMGLLNLDPGFEQQGAFDQELTFDGDRSLRHVKGYPKKGG